MPQKFDSNKPIYIQIRERVEDMILDGQLKPDEQAPSTNQLADFYKINHITVAKGMNQLVDEGILYKRRGIGLFVSAGAREKLMQARHTAFVTEYLQPLLAEARKVGITKEEILQMIDQLKEGEHDGQED